MRSGVAPVVKAIWTPSWVLFSGGWCFLMLAAFYGLVDGLGFRRAVFPLTVIGMNSIVAYSLAHLYPALAFNSLERVFGSRVFQLLGDAYQPMLYGRDRALAVLAALCICCISAECLSESEVAWSPAVTFGQRVA